MTGSAPAGAVAGARAWPTALLGLPLAFVALPLYVQLPNHYASEFGIRWPRWARCCWARGCSTRWPTR
jgi:hypothetical protein